MSFLQALYRFFSKRRQFWITLAHKRSVLATDQARTHLGSLVPLIKVGHEQDEELDGQLALPGFRVK